MTDSGRQKLRAKHAVERRVLVSHMEVAVGDAVVVKGADEQSTTAPLEAGTAGAIVVGVEPGAVGASAETAEVCG